MCVRRVGRHGPASRKTAGSVGDLTPVVKISAPPVFARRLRNGLSVPANVIKRRRKSHCRPAFLQPAGPFPPFCRLFGGTARLEGRPCGAFRSRPGRVAGLPPGRGGCAVGCRISFLFDKKNVPLRKSKRGVAGRAGCAAVAARRSAASPCPSEGRNKRAPGGARPPARCARPLAGVRRAGLGSAALLWILPNLLLRINSRLVRFFTMLVKKTALPHGLRPLLLVGSPWVNEAERGHFRLWPLPLRSFPFPPCLYRGIPVFFFSARIPFSSARGVPPPAGAMRVRRWFSVSHPPCLYSGISVFPLPARVSFSSACGVPGVRGVRFRA